jgi:hypothetical protein
MSNNEFSKDEIKNITNKVSAAAQAVTGMSPGGSQSGAGSRSGSDGGIMNLLTCSIGSDCYKTKHDNDLKTLFAQAQENLNNAPMDLSRAEKNYYVYNKGNDGGTQIYNKTIFDRFASTAREFKKNSIDRQQQFMADLSQALKQYQAQILFQEQSIKLLQTRQEEQNDLIKNINYYQKVLQTSERKAVYENKNMDSLYNYRRIMTFIYYACIVCFVIFGNFIPDKLYTNYSIWIIIVIASVFPLILNILIKWLFVFYDMMSYWLAELPHKDVYTYIGNPADDKPPTKPRSASVIQNPLLDALALSPTISAALTNIQA